MVTAGGARKGSGHLENYDNIVLISADRNGSTAFQQDLLGANLNNDHVLWLGECFSQDPQKDQPPSWYDPDRIKPKDVIDTVNIGTGKSVLLKIQITYPNFSSDFLEINATRRIFFHRNLFDSTLSRCIAQKTGHWFKFDDETYQDLNIPVDFFIARLEYRIERYQSSLDDVLLWANEVYRYETHSYGPNLKTKPNPNKKDKVANYDELYRWYLDQPEIHEIENKILPCLTTT